MSDQEEPWWYRHCMHPQHDLDACWEVMREEEGVAILFLGCLHRIHILVYRPELGAVCQVLTREDYYHMSEVDLLSFIQEQVRTLRAAFA